jgi:hypothetical protein
MCTASRSPPEARDAMRAARRIRVSPSGPPVSATTTRSRVSADAVLGPIALQALVDAVGEPEQREFAQRGEVALAEVVRQRRVDLVRLVDVAVCHPPAQRLRRHVDELDLLRRAHHGVRHRLLLADAGDRLDDVVERLEVLDVDRADHVDAGFEQRLDVLPALLVLAARHVGVCQLVDESDLRAPGQDGRQVQFGEVGVAVADRATRDHLQAGELVLRVRAGVRLRIRHDHVRAPRGPALPLVEHGVGLAHTRRGAEVDPELTSRHDVVTCCGTGTAGRGRC